MRSKTNLSKTLSQAKTRPQETVAQRRKRIFAEARDLVDDRARSCDLCRRRMRYWPGGGQTVERAVGRYFSWRCDLCFFASEIFVAALAGHSLSPVQVLRGRELQAQELTAHLTELLGEPTGELLSEAMDRLCLQLQDVAEQIQAARAAIAHGRNIVLYSDVQLGRRELAGSYIPWTPHPPAPAQA